MSFAAPAALWGLLALPLILLLYMLRTRRVDAPVSTLLLWQRARQDLLAHRPARRLERSLLLVLQLLAVALLVLAAARPQVHFGATGQPTIIIVDASASMQATDVSPFRFAVARQAAMQAAQAARGPVMIIAAGPRARVVLPFSDRALAQAALARLRSTDGPAHLEEALALARGQRPPRGRARIEVFTDRAGAAEPSVTYHIVGVSARNVGIAHVGIERDQGGSVVVVQVRNAGDRAERVPVTVSVNARRVATRTIDVPAGAMGSVTMPVGGSGLARIDLGVRDALAVDNVGYAVVGTPPPRVAVVGVPDRVLAAALEAGGAEIIPAERATPEALARSDVVVLNATPPADLPPGNYLLVGSTAPNLPLAVEGTVRGPQVLRWSARHPVMRYVDLRDLAITEALRLIPRGGEVLAEAEAPLIWAYEGDGRRVVLLAFRADQSDLPLRPAFPILLSNALTWLSGAGRSYSAGETIAIPAGTASEAVLVDPDGRETRLAASGGRFLLPAIERAGIYRLRTGDRDRVVAVNPDPEETVIAPVHPSQAAETVSGVSPAGVAEAWWVFLAAALAVVCAEWVLWLRTLPRLSGATLPAFRRGNFEGRR